MKTFVLFVSLAGIIACKHKIEPDDNTAIKDQITTTADDINSVKKLIKGSFEDIWSKLDSNKIENYHTEDFFLLENGVVWNNDSIRNYLNRERKEMESQKYRRLNRFEFLKFVHNQNSIWIAYDNYGTWVRETDTLGTVHWLESVIAIKDEDEWKLQQLHSTTVRNK